MTARYGMKTCTSCGTEFAKSAADYTVRCPACRESARHTKGTRGYSTADWEAAAAWYVRMGEARTAARAAEAAGDTAGYEAAVADWTFAKTRVDEARARGVAI